MVVIVNPQSQNGQLGRRWTQLAADLRRAVGAFDDVLTRQAGDATELARQAIDNGADMVVAIGGDGTINEVANGFFRDGRPINRDAVFGVLPYGTGGDFRKTVSLPKDIYEAGRILVEGHKKRIDAGRIDFVDDGGKQATRMFVNIASFGISGLVDNYVNKTTKALGGKVSFLLATARAALEYQNRRVRLVFDGDESGAVTRTVLSVAVANGRYFGGGMFIAPEAELDDGQLDRAHRGPDEPDRADDDERRRQPGGDHREHEAARDQRASEDVRADVAVGVSVVECLGDPLVCQRHLAADVEEAAAETGGVAGDQAGQRLGLERHPGGPGGEVRDPEEQQ